MKRFIVYSAVVALAAGIGVFALKDPAVDRSAPVPADGRRAPVPEGATADDWAAALSDPDLEATAEASHQLEAAPAGTAAVVRALLSNRDPEIRSRAVEIALARADRRDFLPAIADLLLDPDAGVRWRAAYDLAKLGPAAAVAAPLLVRSLTDPSLRNQTSAAYALAALGDAAGPALVETLREPNTILAARPFHIIADTFQQIGGGAACVTSALSLGLRHAEPAVRRQAALVLRRLERLGDGRLDACLKDEVAEEALLKSVLDDDDAGVRVAAAKALAEVPAERRAAVAKSLREGRHDPDPAARAAIVDALRRLGDPEEDPK